MFVKLERVGDHSRTLLGVFDPVAWRGGADKKLTFQQYKAQLDAAEGVGDQRRGHLEETPLADGEWSDAWGDKSHPAHPANRKPADAPK